MQTATKAKQATSEDVDMTETGLDKKNHPTWTDDLQARAKTIQLVGLDVDGVLTDGGIYYDDAGHEFKRFHVRDGHGLRLLMAAGLAVGVITARQSPMVSRRCDELQLSFCLQGRPHKWAALEEEMAKRQITPQQCAFMGDDLLDLEILTRVGLAAAPADAHPEVARRVHWITTLGGGQGAVRELADQILAAQGQISATVP